MPRDEISKKARALVMKSVLQYVYTGKVNVISEATLLPRLMDAAEKYMLPELKDECALQLIGDKDLSDEEWIEHLRLAGMFNVGCMRKICLLALSTNMSSLGKGNNRENISAMALTELLDLVTKRGRDTKAIDIETDKYY